MVKEDIIMYKKLIKDTINELKYNNQACILFNENSFSVGSQPSDKLNAFFDYLYDCNLIDTNYLENHKKIVDKSIENMNEEEVLTEVTFIIRSERFVGGSLYQYFVDGTLLKLVERLNVLLNKEESNIFD